MSSVPLPGVGARPAAPRRRGLWHAAAGLLAVCAVALGVVAHAQDGPTAARAVRAASPAPSPSFAGIIAGVPMQQAACRHWLAGTPAEREGTVAALAQTVGGPSTTGGYGRTLSRASAFRLFDSRCAQPGSGSFLLYEMYTRLAAFGG